jgi:hypothetical protein
MLLNQPQAGSLFLDDSRSIRDRRMDPIHAVFGHLCYCQKAMMTFENVVVKAPREVTVAL